jgi:crotonobetainyl-CoA:carnitine CoA-transferase CaiB-like acyl-CoA transferase
VTGEPGEMPMRPGIQTADIFGALFATYAALSGLISVLKNRGGKVADVSLVEASIAAAAWETAFFLATGEVPERLGNQHRLNAPYQLFETSDGHYLAIGTPNDELFKRFMTVLDLEAYLSDPRFMSYVLRKQNEADLLSIVEPIVSQRKAAELESILMEAGVPCSKMNNIKEVFEDPHMIDRGITVDVEHPVMGKMKTVRNPVLFSEESPSIRKHAPSLGEHSAEILEELGYKNEDITQLATLGIVLLKNH